MKKFCASSENRNQSGVLFRSLIGIGLVAMLLITSCEKENSENEEAAALIINATEIAKRAPSDIRDSYVLFSITANQSLTDYHQAVKKTTDTAHTAAEMKAGALKWNIGPESINILIAQWLNAQIIQFAEKFFANNADRTLGTGMLGASWDANFAMILDKTASGSNAWIAESVLEPSLNTHSMA